MTSLFAPLIELWKRLSLGQRAGLVLAVGLALAIVAGTVNYTTRPVMSPLYSGLSQKDAAAIADGLRDQKIPFEVSSDGSIIKVPQVSVAELRLQFAEKGLPRSGEIGYELFDKPMLGMTDFMQKMNYHRALEGELSRTISEIEGVESARVHIVVPQPRLFKEDTSPTTASVVLNLESGASLSPKQVQAICHMTAFSVEGLDIANISILDSRGNLLSNNKSDDMAGLTSSQQEYQQSIESALERKATALLEDVLGEDRARVRVTVQLNWNRVERTIEDFDPERTATLSEEVQSSEGSEDGTTERTITNYHVPRTVEKIVPEVGNIEKLWASVLVDGNYETVTGADGTETKTYVERTPQELDKFRSLIAGAIGYDTQRSDELSVLSFQFTSHEEPVNQPTGWLNNAFLMKIIEKVVIIALLVLIFLLVKSMISKMSARYPGLPGMEAMASIPAPGGAMSLGAPGGGGSSAIAGSKEAAIGAGHQTAEQKAQAAAEAITQQLGPKVIFKQSPQTIVLEAEGPSVETLKHQELLKRATEYAIAQPDNAAQILRSWILDESS